MKFEDYKHCLVVNQRENKINCPDKKIGFDSFKENYKELKKQ